MINPRTLSLTPIAHTEPLPERESTPYLPGLERHLAGDLVRRRIDPHHAGSDAGPHRIVSDREALAALSGERDTRDDLVRLRVDAVRDGRLFLVGRRGPHRAEPLEGPIGLARDVLEDGLGSGVDRFAGLGSMRSAAHWPRRQPRRAPDLWPAAPRDRRRTLPARGQGRRPRVATSRAWGRVTSASPAWRSTGADRRRASRPFASVRSRQSGRVIPVGSPRALCNDAAHDTGAGSRHARLMDGHHRHRVSSCSATHYVGVGAGAPLHLLP